MILDKVEEDKFKESDKCLRVMVKLFIVFITIGCVVCVFQDIAERLNLKEDNVIEEFIEDVIEEELDIRIDLTPSSTLT